MHATKEYELYKGTASTAKPWESMTGRDIYNLKMRQCTKCKYFSYGYKKEDAKSYNSSTSSCNYLAWTGHCRRCDPRDCVELGIFEPKEKGRKRKSKPMKVKEK